MFNEINLADDGATLVVVGTSTAFDWSEVRVAIHDLEDVNRRLDGHVPTPIEMSPWQAVLDQPQEVPFEQGEPVFVIGQAMSQEGELFLWANQLDIT
jgi:hypothetical protein